MKLFGKYKNLHANLGLGCSNSEIYNLQSLGEKVLDQGPSVYCGKELFKQFLG